jgi:hypothetical protein
MKGSGDHLPGDALLLLCRSDEKKDAKTRTNASIDFHLGRYIQCLSVITCHHIHIYTLPSLPSNVPSILSTVSKNVLGIRACCAVF